MTNSLYLVVEGESRHVILYGSKKMKRFLQNAFQNHNLFKIVYRTTPLHLMCNKIYNNNYYVCPDDDKDSFDYIFQENICVLKT